MMIHEITEKVGKYKDRKRIGRGEASGWGKTAGRGHKGAGSRAGNTYRAYFEGGQMPFARRIPKRGFSNSAFRRNYHVVNLKTLEARLEDGAEVTVELLAAVGIVRDTNQPLKILGEGELTKKLTVTAAKFSGSAREKIEKAGGTVNEVVRKKWVRDRSVKKDKAGAKAGTKDAGPKKATADQTDDA